MLISHQNDLIADYSYSTLNCVNLSPNCKVKEGGTLGRGVQHLNGDSLTAALSSKDSSVSPQE